MKEKVNKHFVSEIDQDLVAWREQFEDRDSQRRERKKYDKINQLRDNVQEDAEPSGIWEDF